MKQINITRDSSGNVTFETVSIDVTENVFFTNQDPDEAHWPTLATNQLGTYPSPNSSQCTVPTPDNLTPPNNQVTYGCQLHDNEQGIINVFAQLAAATTDLAQATKGKPITRQQVVEGGMSPYAISGQIYQVTDSNGNVIKSGTGSIGPGLSLSASTNSDGIWVSGTPTMSGTYNFTFTVNDAMGRNLQQVQYSMVVA
ncbi:MAG TPA: putative Ig domain-containing protein [Pyrinomonadaceae bacterium]|nr:putative Ig domain-containing protein [Pyrinomonadaceae bacterium]